MKNYALFKSLRLKVTLILSLFFAVSVGNALATDPDYTYTLSSSDFTSNTHQKTSGALTWTHSHTSGTESYGWDNDYGFKFGSGNKSYPTAFKLTSSSVSNKIKKVVATASVNSGKSCKLDVKVGSTTYGSQATINTKNNDTWEFEIADASTVNGAVELSFSSNTGPLYLKKIEIYYYSSGGGSDPSISASDVNIAYSATNGSIAYTLKNATGNVSASVTTGDWLSLGTVTASAVPFTCSANSSTTARTATVTLSFTGASDKVVTVTQAAAPLSTMDAIFAAATSAGSTATPVAVTFNNWVVTGATTNNAYVTDGTKGFIIYQASHGFAVGNVLSGTASCSVQLYKGAAEITGLSSTTTGLTVSTGGVVTPVTNVAIADLSGTNTGAVFSYQNLSYNGTVLSDGENTIKPYNSLYSYTMTNGKTYNVTGVYVQYDETKEILPRSSADVVEVVPVVPTIVASVNSLSGFTYPETQGPSDAKSFTVSGSNLTANIGLSVTGDYYEISLTQDSGYTNSLELTQSAGSVSETTVYARLKEGLAVNNSYAGSVALTSTGASNVSVSLSGSVTAAPVTSLPFSFDDGKNDIASKAGLSADGLGSDYANSPKLKFDGTGDWVLLHFNEAPGTLTFDIKGNSFSDGTFKVQCSSDGSNFTDVATYTTLGDKESKEIDNLASSVRYIKWIYTEKVNGNVALGNISLAKYAPPVPKITLDKYSVEATSAQTNGSLTLTYTSIETGEGVDVVWYSDNTGASTTTEPDWIDASIDGTTLSYQIAANAGAARSAYFKVKGKDAGSNIVYSNIVTVSQAAFVADYATLPFEFTGGSSGIENTPGLTQDGLGTDYGTAPYLKFDTTGDYVILKFNAAPGVLTFDIKGNSFSNGTFKVQSSSDGSSYTDVATYTTLGDTETKEIDNLASEVRYIKWIYTEKNTGNVALGNIALAAFAPRIGLSTYSVEAPAAETVGTITASYTAIDTDALDILWFESDGMTEAAEVPSWVLVDFNQSNNVEYLIDANTGAARTAYFKVMGFDGEANEVYSNLVTVSQAEYVAPTPEITLEKYSVVATSAETEGDITLTLVAIETTDIVWYTDNTGTVTTDEPAWIDAEINGTTLSYIIAENAGAARTAYFKVMGLDGEANEVYSNIVTVSQAAPSVAGNWVLTDLASLTPNDVFVIVGDNGDTYALSNNKGSSAAPTAVEVTVDNGTLSGEIPETIQWTLSGNASDGYVFYPDGSTTTWLYCTNTNNGVRVGTGDACHFTLEDGYLTTSETSEQRFIGVYNSADWRCYVINNKGELPNIAGQTFTFYKKVISADPVINLSGTEDKGFYWATFYSGAADYALPEGAQAFTLNEDKNLYRIGANGSVIPAGEAVIIVSNTQDIVLNVKTAKTADLSIHGTGGNILEGSDSSVDKDSIIAAGKTPYVLGVYGGVLGFYEYTGSSIPANKAYYAE